MSNASNRFGRVEPAEWKLESKIQGNRQLELLSGPPYEEIVERIVSEMKLASVRVPKITDCRVLRAHPETKYYRVEITIKVAARTVDLFHNSASGYRAQYYINTIEGERANAFAVAAVSERLLTMIAPNHRRRLERPLIEKSIMHRRTKIWIHQGRWLRESRKALRNLIVDRWNNEIGCCSLWSSKNGKFWSMLTPANETQLVIKGNPITQDGQSLRINLKPDRARMLSKCGFT
ncbi:MAG TPA: hypothetical protein PKD26_13230 [Pyrinomonadaceae bacterium]|nr:hypothetical protein [Pyrinomonadaceae bacterium]